MHAHAHMFPYPLTHPPTYIHTYIFPHVCYSLDASSSQEMKPKGQKGQKYPAQFPSYDCGFPHLNPSKHELLLLFPNRASCGLDLLARNNRKHVAPGNDFSTIRRLRFKFQISSSLNDQVISQSIKRGTQFSDLNVLCQC